MQRRRLQLAFSEVLLEGGLEAAGVGRVCARAGVSRRTFYDLFDDREDCFSAAFAAAIERISSTVVPAYTRGPRWTTRMRSALAVLLRLFDEEPALLHVCLIESLKAGPGVLEQRRQALDTLAAAVDEGRSEARRRVGPAPLTAESTVGGAVSVICARVLQRDPRPLSELLNPLMSMIVQPYLGPTAARQELEHELPPSAQGPFAQGNGGEPGRVREPFKDLPIRITFRTARVLATIAAQPGASNRQIGDAAGVADQGQMSKLLSRLEGCALIENRSPGHDRGEPNAWRLTARGEAVQQAIE
jgi:AcrR family transcriptional regulator